MRLALLVLCLCFTYLDGGNVVLAKPAATPAKTPAVAAPRPLKAVLAKANGAQLRRGPLLSMPDGALRMLVSSVEQDPGGHVAEVTHLIEFNSDGVPMLLDGRAVDARSMPAEAWKRASEVGAAAARYASTVDESLKSAVFQAAMSQRQP